MSISKKLETFLKSNHVTYEVIDHPRAFTAQGTAKAEHVTGKEVAKVIIARSGDKDLMAVIPAHRMLSLTKLSTAVGGDNLTFEDEGKLGELFPDCELGAMPPFGKLYDLPCYVDESVLEFGDICFNGGNHNQSIRIKTDDFRRVAGAEFGDFTS